MNDIAISVKNLSKKIPPCLGIRHQDLGTGNEEPNMTDKLIAKGESPMPSHDEIGIFGSFVRGEQKQHSDIDILVDFDQRNIPGLLKLSEMERYLQWLLDDILNVSI